MKAKSLFIIGLLSLGLAGCESMTAQEKCTVGGAVIGGVAGSILSDQSGVGTAGGAAVGGVLGHEVSKKGRCL